MIASIAPVAPVVNTVNNTTPVSVTDRNATQSSDNGEARRVAAETQRFVRETKDDQPVDDNRQAGLAVRQSLSELQASRSTPVPNQLVPGPRGTNVDILV